MSSVIDPKAGVAAAGGVSAAPLVVDIGKKPRKQIRQLRRGTGKLMDEVNGIIEQLQSNGTLSEGAQPLVVVVRQKRGRRSALWPMA